MSRTRSRNTIVEFQGSTEVKVDNQSQVNVLAPDSSRWCLPGITEWTRSGSDHSPAKSGVIETITDEIGPSSYNTCHHSKEQWDCPLQTVESKGETSPSANVTVTCNATIGAAAAVEFGLTSIPYMGTEEEMVAEATADADPSRVQPGEFGLTQFVGELTELRFIHEQIAGNLVKLLTAFSKRKGGGLGVSSATIGELVQGAVSADLTYKFAIRPFINDIVKLDASLRGLTRLFDKLRNPNPFRVYGVSRRESSGNFVASGYPYSKFEWGNTREYSVACHVWAMIQYANPLSSSLLGDSFMTSLGSLGRHVDALIDYYKISSPISTAWQLMPLSFLVDGVVDIGSFLDQLDGQALELDYQVLDSGYSMKHIQKSVGYIKHDAGYTRVKFQSVEAYPLVTGRLIRTQYHREASVLPWDTAQLKSPRVSIPNLGQAGTVLELIYMARR